MSLDRAKGRVYYSASSFPRKRESRDFRERHWIPARAARVRNDERFGRAKDMGTTAKLFLVIGAVAALLGVLLGAFGAHALKARLAADAIALWRTAVEYHFYHALGLLAVGLTAAHLPQPAPSTSSGQALSPSKGSALLRWSGWLMLAGIALFSGSLYLLALSGARWLGAITPVGGAAFIAAWVLLAAAILRA
jgi:uncharacterized membrane protein YgdD (TMEM256/DUF423 family)